MVFHFGKRCLESLFLHKYSKPTGATAYLLIIWAYSTMVLAGGWFQTHAVTPRRRAGRPGCGRS